MSDTETAAPRRRGRPSRPKGTCRAEDCNEPELCQGLCRRCYQIEYVIKKKAELANRSAEPGPKKSASTSSKKKTRGVWITPEGEELETPFVVDIAKNSRTKCHASKERIQRDELRIGILRSRGTPAVRWYRLEHFPAPTGFTLRKLHGRKRLDHDDRASLLKLFGHLEKDRERHRPKHHRHSSSSASSSSRSRTSKNPSAPGKRGRPRKNQDPESPSDESSKRRRGASDESPTMPHHPPPLDYQSSSGSDSGYSDGVPDQQYSESSDSGEPGQEGAW